jgi:hypothetical protein
MKKETNKKSVPAVAPAAKPAVKPSRIMISFERLPEELQTKLLELYPEGFEGVAKILTLPNGTYFKAFDYEADGQKYLVKVPMEVDRVNNDADDVDEDDDDVVIPDSIDNDIPDDFKKALSEDDGDDEDDGDTHIVRFDEE